jgi:hypothetical protein
MAEATSDRGITFDQPPRERTVSDRRAGRWNGCRILSRSYRYIFGNLVGTVALVAGSKQMLDVQVGIAKSRTLAPPSEK